ncbi:hypothetical protein Goklo_002864 [Gossypium klotzschianum]|uniref:Uncharacterized protein n=1 Tax=Gossypium klotzschianum TaxID=34286 RepID=A0A7J8VVL7_9ROSI|nr:hypothetical protein [Gossypium klotzschianum]
MQPPFPKWYDANTQCEYHVRITGHSIENCTAFKKLIERFIKIRIVRFDDPQDLMWQEIYYPVILTKE